MKKYFSQYLFLIVAVFALQACQTMHAPETVNERLATVEIGYQSVLKTATRWRTEGRLTDEQVAKFDQLFDDYESRRSLVKAALNLNDITTAETDLIKLSGTLTTLRNLVAEIENE